jgi:hypothetical protein
MLPNTQCHPPFNKIFSIFSSLEVGSVDVGYGKGMWW